MQLTLEYRNGASFSEDVPDWVLAGLQDSSSECECASACRWLREQYGKFMVCAYNARVSATFYPKFVDVLRVNVCNSQKKALPLIHL